MLSLKKKFKCGPTCFHETFCALALIGEPPPRPPASYELYCELGRFQNDVVPIKLNADSMIVPIIAVVCPRVAPLSTAVIEYY